MNFSISEILIIILIALLVIKPEQLPEVAHMLWKLMQTMRRLFGKIKQEVNEFIDGEGKR